MMKSLKKFFISLKTNIKLILTAVVASAVIWLAISLQIFPDIEKTIEGISVQINPNALVSGLSLAEDYEFSTNITIRGKRYDIGPLNAGDFEATVDLSDITEAEIYDLPIAVRGLSTVNFEIVSSVKTAKIKVNSIETKTLELIPKAENVRVVDGMRIDEPELAVSPATITISGEKSMIDSITTAEVHAVIEEEVLATTVVSGRLVLLNSEGIEIQNADIIRDNESFSVTVPIHKVRTLPLKYMIKGAPGNFDLAGLEARMDIIPSELRLSSPNTSIDLLTHFDVGEIPLNEITLQMLLTPTRETIAPKLAEAGYKNISGNASFSLHFKDVSDYIQREFTIPANGINIMNRPVDFDIDVLTEELTVTVVGPAHFVQSMTAADIGATLNLAGMEMSMDSRTASMTVQCRINGSKVPAWIVGYPQIEVTFTRIEPLTQEE